MGRARVIALTGIALLLAVMAAVAGCQQPGSSIPPPAFFSPSPCPPGWHRAPDAQDPGAWSCFISGTLGPGQPLPLPVIDGTPLPVPPPLQRATATPQAAS